MSLKILGGLAKSRSLFVSKGQNTRPTSVLLKRRVFDSYQDLTGRHFVDLCAGSGAIGIEAWSRGAESLTLVENHHQAVKAIKENIKMLRTHYDEDFRQRSIRLQEKKVEAWFKNFIAPKEGTSIFFLDPPYEIHKIYQTIGLGLLRSRGTNEVWVESDKDKGLPLSFWSESGFEPDKVYVQGASYLAIFRHES